MPPSYRFPVFDELSGIKVFVKDLRTNVFKTEKEAARYFRRNRSRVAHDESEKDPSNPPLGYVAALAGLNVKRLRLSRMEATKLKDVALGEVNHAVVAAYSGTKPFSSWAELSHRAFCFVMRNRHRETKAASEVGLVRYQLARPLDNFVGRKQELSHLSGTIRKGVRLVCIYGMGGVGKTSLGRKFAATLRRTFPVAQLEFDLRGNTPEPLAPRVVMTWVIKSLGWPNALPDEIDKLGGIYRHVLDNKRILLFFDNAGSAEQIVPLLPPPGPLLLTTSRKHFELPEMAVLPLNTMPLGEAQTMLFSLTKRIKSQQAKQISVLCDYLPLALRLVGSALTRPDVPVSDFIRRLTVTRSRLELIDHALGVGQPPPGLRASLSLSYQLLDRRGRQNWRALAVFPDSFDLSGCAAVWQVAPDEALDQLGDFLAACLVEWNKTTGRYRLHDLLHQLASAYLKGAERLAREREHSRYYGTLATRGERQIYEALPGWKHGYTLLEQEADNITAGETWAKAHRQTDETARLLCSDYAERVEELLAPPQSPEEIQRQEAALQVTALLKPPHTSGSHRCNLAVTRRDPGRTKRVIASYRKTLATHRKAGSRRGQADALRRLARAYGDLGHFRRAIQYAQKSLKLEREIGNRLGIAIGLTNLAIYYDHLGDLKRALPLYRQAQARCLKIAAYDQFCAIEYTLGVHRRAATRALAKHDTEDLDH